MSHTDGAALLSAGIVTFTFDFASEQSRSDDMQRVGRVRVCMYLDVPKRRTSQVEPKPEPEHEPEIYPEPGRTGVRVRVKRCGQE